VLREYALVADGERGALIGMDGSVAWLCAPRWDSPADDRPEAAGRGVDRAEWSAAVPVVRGRSGRAAATAGWQ
jgi:hypothetical protein